MRREVLIKGWRWAHSPNFDILWSGPLAFVIVGKMPCRNSLSFMEHKSSFTLASRYTLRSGCRN
jgi:hypothetical protein